MKKIIILLTIVFVFVSCKDEVVKKPNRLIEKETMVNIMYDLSVLDAIKYQNPASLDTFKINPTQYIYKKYKIDSLQFARSNVYYASNYKDYSDVVDQINARLTKNKASITALIKAEAKKKKAIKKPILPKSKAIDSSQVL
ncbi:hypothetical protein H4V97_002255 [Flavobacterium sp. CG_23.5]|uniref:DUF4296 domain-containing protein n=1 Tax=unclassified Flavobacterium TaxID=196869 RepID=UPI0018CAF8AC|nr:MULTISPECIES: DUF4296 domain-containing protein [unclassified Flavobacterium]MBG6112023.1 hypothetical protein [Flavobacterium sp. CG_9.10]MBP2283937.1 hypothetical protein [Flavobacterium sp. CG_23.5]